MTAKDLANGMAKVTEDFYTVLGKSKYDFKIDWNRVFKCIDVIVVWHKGIRICVL